MINNKTMMMKVMATMTMILLMTRATTTTMMMMMMIKMVLIMCIMIVGMQLVVTVDDEENYNDDADDDDDNDADCNNDNNEYETCWQFNRLRNDHSQQWNNVQAAAKEATPAQYVDAHDAKQFDTAHLPVRNVTGHVTKLHANPLTLLLVLLVVQVSCCP